MADKPALDLEVKISGTQQGAAAINTIAAANDNVAKSAANAADELARVTERETANQKKAMDRLIDAEVAGAIKAQQAKKAQAAATLETSTANQKAAKSTETLGQALNGLGGRNNSAKDFLEGLKTAANGGAGAFFGLAKSARAAFAIFTGGPVGAIVGVLGLAASAAIAFGVALLKPKKSAEEIAAELEKVKRKADELAAARTKTFQDQLKAIADGAAEATRKIDLLANARERISDAVLGRQIQAIEADTTLGPEQKTQQAEAARKAREKEKADNEIKDQRAKLKVEQDELAKQQAAAVDLERAASTSRTKANQLEGDKRRLNEIPDLLVKENLRVREAGGTDFQVEEATRPLREERRQLSRRLADGSLEKAQAAADIDLKASNSAREAITPQFDKVRQMQEAIDIEVATRRRVEQVQNTKGPVTPRLKNELLRETTNDILNNGVQDSRDGSGGFINGKFVGAPNRSGDGSINGQPLRNALKGPNSIERTQVTAQPIVDEVKKQTEEEAKKAAEEQKSIDTAAAAIAEATAQQPPPLNLAPVVQSQIQYHQINLQRHTTNEQRLEELARAIRTMGEQLKNSRK